MVAATSTELHAIYRELLAWCGPRHWWPADHWFEVMVGAVLTQNTAWINVEKALARMRGHGLLAPEPLLAAPPEQLAESIRSAGYYNLKTRRLRNLTTTLLEDGGLEGWANRETWSLRERLLSINGVGEETADSILLYVFRRPVFVIDAYTRRIFARLGHVQGNEPYRALAGIFEQALGEDEPVYNEYHALIVALGNRVCRPRPLCGECPLQLRCNWRAGV
ncbi:MAG: endonuclease III domain-containing protein [Aquisalimonadaceae bacterium]